MDCGVMKSRWQHYIHGHIREQGVGERVISVRLRGP